MTDELYIKLLLGSSICSDLLSNNQDKWRTATNSLDFVPYEYTVSAIKYYCEYMKASNDVVVDISHFIRDNNTIIGVWALQVRRNDGAWHIGSNYSGVISPLYFPEISERIQKKSMRQCADFLLRIASELDVNQLEFRMQSFRDGADYWHTLWMNRGSVITNVDHVCYVNLSLSVSQIQKKIRRRYIGYINESKRIWNTKVIDTYDPIMFSQYKSFHHLIAGRVTRGEATWKEQSDALANREAFLVFVTNKENDIIGAAYFFHSKDECYYLSGAYNRDLFQKPVSHIVQYLAILYCKEHGLQYYRIGERYYKGDVESHTEKEYSISNFKEGFATNLFLSIKMRHRNE